MSRASIRVSEKLWEREEEEGTSLALWHTHISRAGLDLPAPGVLTVTGEWAELVVGKGVVKVTVVGVVEHGFDALPEK